MKELKQKKQETEVINERMDETMKQIQSTDTINEKVNVKMYNTTENERMDVNMKQKTNFAEEEARRVVARLDELCEGTPEDHFDVWCRKRLYPVLALYDVMPFGVDRKMYERRLEELCEGKPENEFDKWLRERFYPIVAIFTRAGKNLE